VLDASGSTGNSSGTCSEILACEKTFFTGLNTAATSSGSVNHVRLVVFGADAVQADMTPAGGDDPLGAPADGNTPIGSVVLTNGGFNYHVGSELNASTDSKKLMVFVSDGLSNQGGLAAFDAAVSAIQGTGTIVNSIAIAGGACTGGSDGDLADIAVNGGTCVNVPDPNACPT
jgi:hypothetical protein